MRAKTLQIVWHCKEPVFSLDFSPCEPRTLITAGADKDIKVRCCNVTLHTIAHGLTLHRPGHDAVAVCLDVRSLHVPCLPVDVTPQSSDTCCSCGRCVMWC